LKVVNGVISYISHAVPHIRVPTSFFQWRHLVRLPVNVITATLQHRCVSANLGHIRQDVTAVI